MGDHAGDTTTFSGITVKNSVVIGQRGVGALVGQTGGSGNIVISGDITLNNVHVKTTGGRSALLIGYDAGNSQTATLKISNSADINIANSDNTIFYNEASKTKVYDKTSLTSSNSSVSITASAPTQYAIDESIVESNTLVYSVKTFNADGSVKTYSLYGFCEAALYVVNETRSSKGHTINKGAGAYTSIEDLKATFPNN